MNIEKNLDDLRSIQASFIEFIENEENVEENFQNLCMKLEEKKIRDNKHDLSLFLHHVSRVCANHNRGQNFFGKIERVLQINKESIKQFYKNSTIFNIFKRNKRILLFLIEENIINFDECVAKTIIEEYVKKKYPQYFAPELKTFTDKDWFPKFDPDNKIYGKKWIEEINKELPDNFKELRKNYENDNLYQLIVKDNIEDFITYVNKNEISVQTKIKASIFETNSFLLSQGKTSLIELSAFYGANQIFKYCLINKSKIKPRIWLYAIHGQNPEIIHLLEENSIEPPDGKYDICIKEAIKCHHNDIVNYLMNNYEQNEVFISHLSVKYFNFEYIDINSSDMKIFFDFCKYNYTLFAEYFIKYRNIDVNQRSFEIVEMKDKIVDISQKNKYGKIEYGKVLVITKTNFQDTMNVQKAALHIAVENENIEIIQLLLENNNIDVNIKTFESFGCRRNPCEWDWCRDSYWIDGHGISTEKTALYIAVERNNQEIIQMLDINKTKLLLFKVVESNGNYLLRRYPKNICFVNLFKNQV